MPADHAASPDPPGRTTPDSTGDTTDSATDADGTGDARTFESRFRARSYELDAFDHVNHAVFLNWLEQARFDALEAGGLPASEVAAMGWAVVVVHVEIDYHAEVRLGDEVVVRTRLAGVRKTSMTLAQRIVRVRRAPDRAGGAGAGTPPRDGGSGDEVLAAEARVVAVWLREGRPRRIPPEALEALDAR